MHLRHPFAIGLVVMAGLALVAPLRAQDVDFGIQDSDGKLIVGIAGNDVPTPTYPISVLTRDFTAGNLTNEPGFFAYGEGSAAFSDAALDGLDPLPPSTAIGWDFLTMNVDSVESNLMYWDGLDDSTDGIDISDVEFAASTGVEFTLNSTNGSGGAQASVTGTDQFVAGGTLDVTASSGALTPGSLHHHPLFLLSSTGGGSVPDGVYLVSMQLSMVGLETSDPFFLAMRTSTIDPDAETAAAAWVEDNLDMLLGEIVLPGDYDRDGDVDADDYSTWRGEYGMAVAEAGDGADGNADGVVDAADFAFWRNNLPPPGSGAGAAIPEPSTLALLVAALACWPRRK